MTTSCAPSCVTWPPSGAGGVEVAPFYVPGAGNQSNAFLAQYGWGTPLWAHKMEVITDEAAKLGLIVDQNLGPQYPPTVPTLNSFNQPRGRAAADLRP